MSGVAPATVLPQHGVIVGGLLDGWSYAVQRVFDDRQRMQVFMDAMCTPPGWPFPRLVRLSMWRDFDALAPTKTKVVRDLPQMLDWDKVLGAAVQTALDAETSKKRKHVSSVLEAATQ